MPDPTNVDVVGVDAYLFQRSPGSPPDPKTSGLGRDRPMSWITGGLVRYAASIGKPWAIGVFGAHPFPNDTTKRPTWIRETVKWIEANGGIAAIYFHSGRGESGPWWLDRFHYGDTAPGSDPRSIETWRDLLNRQEAPVVPPVVPPAGKDRSFPRDVTGDRKADLLAIESYTSALRVYPGNNRGGTSSPVIDRSTKWASYPVALTAGTFDTDALSDVLLIDTSGRLFLRPGQGAGTFGPARAIGTGWDAVDLVTPVGDFDGDKRRPHGALQGLRRPLPVPG